jgi:DNA-binding response OmpR family regulator
LIIGVTGNVLDDDVNEYLEAGADLVIGKPLRMELLNKLLVHIQMNGSDSKYEEGYRLVETSDELQWSINQSINQSIKINK